MKTKIDKAKLKTGLWVLIGILLIAVVYATFFRDTSAAVSLGSNAGPAASAYSGMVGGC